MKKRTKRTHYLKINPVEHAMYQASLLSTAEWNEQMIPVITAIEQLAQGNWDRHVNWSPIFQALNRIEAILHTKHVDGNEFVERAQKVFVTALDRNQTTGACAFKADELATIREVGQVYGSLLSEICRRDFKAACNYANANVDRIVRQRGVNTIIIGGCILEAA